MTWTWIGDDFTDRPNVLSLTDAAFRLHIEALVYCNRNGLDGAMPRIALPRVGRPAEGTVAELVASGLWDATPDGWALDWHDQETAAEVEERRSKWRERDERRRLHNKGDHSKCDPERCWALRGDTSLTGEHTREPTRDSRPSHSHSHSPSHSPKEWEGKDGAGARSADAARAAPGGKNHLLVCPHGITNGIRLGQCTDPDCVDEYEELSICTNGGCSLAKLGEPACNTGHCWRRDEWLPVGLAEANAEMRDSARHAS